LKTVRGLDHAAMGTGSFPVY